MEPPVCEVCGGRHWSRQGHLVIDMPITKGVTKPTVTKSAVTKDVLRVYRWRLRNPDRYRDYMREYMRRRKIK